MPKPILNGWTKTVIAILGIVFAAGILYACVTQNTDKINVNCDTLHEIDGKVDSNTKEVVGLKKDVEYIREKVDAIYNSVQK